MIPQDASHITLVVCHCGRTKSSWHCWWVPFSSIGRALLGKKNVTNGYNNNAEKATKGRGFHSLTSSRTGLCLVSQEGQAISWRPLHALPMEITLSITLMSWRNGSCIISTSPVNADALSFLGCILDSTANKKNWRDWMCSICYKSTCLNGCRYLLCLNV